MACPRHHDPSHVAIKVHDFTTAVPPHSQARHPLIRTSVDHGTVFGIARMGVADAAGAVATMRAALAEGTFGS